MPGIGDASVKTQSHRERRDRRSEASRCEGLQHPCKQGVHQGLAMVKMAISKIKCNLRCLGIKDWRVTKLGNCKEEKMGSGRLF